MQRPVRCSHAPPHQRSSCAALAGDGLLVGGRRAGMHGCLSLHSAALQAGFRQAAGLSTCSAGWLRRFSCRGVPAPTKLPAQAAAPPVAARPPHPQVLQLAPAVVHVQRVHKLLVSVVRRLAELLVQQRANASPPGGLGASRAEEGSTTGLTAAQTATQTRAWWPQSPPSLWGKRGKRGGAGAACYTCTVARAAGRRVGTTWAHTPAGAPAARPARPRSAWPDAAVVAFCVEHCPSCL